MMLENIPTHVIAGPLGAGKTSLIRQLMAQRPAGERWAVLINEFGEVGLDAALLSTADDGIALGEVAGGCLCCVNGAPFQVGLARLLRKAKPHRLFIEPSGLGHPLQLLAQLKEAPWRGVLAVQPPVMVLDGQALACGQLLPAAQQQAFSSMGLVVVNKSADLPVDKILWIKSQVIDIPIYFTEAGFLPISELRTVEAVPGVVDKPPKPASEPVFLWIDPHAPLRAVHNAEGGWSVGWRWHPDRVFDVEKLDVWLSTARWRRAKGVVHSAGGWLSFNAVDKNAPGWRASEWRKDTRVELIFDHAQDEQALEQGLRGCLVG